MTSGRGSMNAHQPASLGGLAQVLCLGAFWKEIECFGSGQYGAVRLNWLLHGPGRAGGLFLKRSIPRASCYPSPSVLWGAMVCVFALSALGLGQDWGLTIAFSVIFRTQSGPRWHPGGGRTQAIPRQDWMETAKYRAVCVGRVACS